MIMDYHSSWSLGSRIAVIFIKLKGQSVMIIDYHSSSSFKIIGYEQIIRSIVTIMDYHCWSLGSVMFIKLKGQSSYDNRLSLFLKFRI